MSVAERDRLLMASPAELRTAGLDVPDGYGDCAAPSAEWATEVDAILARDRQARALRALSGLTHDDVVALLSALAEARR